MKSIDWLLAFSLFAASSLFWALVALIVAGLAWSVVVFVCSLLLGLCFWAICLAGGQEQ